MSHKVTRKLLQNNKLYKNSVCREIFFHIYPFTPQIRLRLYILSFFLRDKF